jgi:hypothetical protein
MIVGIVDGWNSCLERAFDDDHRLPKPKAGRTPLKAIR